MAGLGKDHDERRLRGLRSGDFDILTDSAYFTGDDCDSRALMGDWRAEILGKTVTTFSFSWNFYSSRGDRLSNNHNCIVQYITHTYKSIITVPIHM